MAFVLAGCASTYVMMPTPTLYTGSQHKPLFVDLSSERKTTSLDLLFITDRAPATDVQQDEPYTAARARSMAFGSTVVDFGNVTWDALVRQSVAIERSVPLELKLGPTKEIGRFPPIPYDVAVTAKGIWRSPATVDAHGKGHLALPGDRRCA